MKEELEREKEYDMKTVRAIFHELEKHPHTIFDMQEQLVDVRGIQIDMDEYVKMRRKFGLKDDEELLTDHDLEEMFK